MEQAKDIVTLIRENYDAFSKSHRILADFILENLHEVGFLSISQLSQRAGVSPATITRFARRLAYQGYPDFQRGIYEQQREWVPFGQLKSLLRSEQPAQEPGQDPLQWTIQSNIQLLQALDTPQLREAFQRSLELLHDAQAVYIAGMRSSYSAAFYLSFMLQQMYEHVHLLSSSASDLPAALSNVRPTDCLLVISYARYTSVTYDIVCHFRQLGCPIISITDSVTSPIALKSTQVLVAPNGGQFSPVSAITLCNSFITCLGRMDRRQTLERMEQQDRIALEHHIYL